MASVPKRHCHRNEPFVDEKSLEPDKDYISNLPDCVLALILSKLPTKYAVATTILSPRWKDLFALIPYPKLECDDSLFLHPENQDYEDKNRGRLNRADNFAKFMDRMFNVILKEVPYISKFSLKCRGKYKDEQMLDWVYAALSRSVPILDIDIYLNHDHWFFDLISDWSCLFSLALRDRISILVLKTVSLPNLEDLVLDKIEIWDDNRDILLLLSGCPMLKRLTMKDLIYSNLDLDDTEIKISVPKLKELRIENCWYNGSVRYFRIVLDTPELEHLYYKDYMPNEFVFSNVSSIKSAHLSVKEFVERDEEAPLVVAQTIEKYNKDVAGLVRACSNAECLFLSKYIVSAFQESNEEVPTFCNLTGLQLGGFNTNGWKLLPQLLANASKLEVFSISEGFHEDEGSFEIFVSQLSKITPFLLSNLKKVDIFELKGDPDEVGLMGYFLIFGKVLDNLEITCDTSWAVYDFIKKKLANMPKLSSRCRITIYNITNEPFN